MARESRFWPMASMAVIVLSFIYPYIVGTGPEDLPAEALQSLRFQHYARTLALLAVWLTAPRGPGLHRLLFLIAGLGLLFSGFVFAAGGIHRLLWAATALCAVWATHYEKAASQPSLASITWASAGNGLPTAGFPAAHYRGGNSVYPQSGMTGGGRETNGFPPAAHYRGGNSVYPQSGLIGGGREANHRFPTAPGAADSGLTGRIFPSPLPGNAFPTGPVIGQPPWPGQPSAQSNPNSGNPFPTQPVIGRGGLMSADPLSGPTSTVVDNVVKINFVVGMLYCAALLAWTFFGQYVPLDDMADEMEIVFSIIALPFVIAPSIMLPAVMYWVLPRAGGGRPVFAALAGAGAAASLLLTVAAVADPLLNGPLSYDRFEALAGFTPVVARWVGAAALVAALALLIARKLDGDPDLEYPSLGLGPSAPAGLTLAAALVFAGAMVWTGGQSYGRIFHNAAYAGPLAAERAGLLELKLPKGFKPVRWDTVFHLESGPVTLREYDIEADEEDDEGYRVGFEATIKNFEPDEDSPERPSRIIELPGYDRPTVITVRHSGNIFLDADYTEMGLDRDFLDKIPSHLGVTLWQKQTGGYISVGVDHKYFTKDMKPGAVDALEEKVLEQFKAWATEAFLPAYHWTGPGGVRPEDRWLTSLGYLDDGLKPGLMARITSENRGLMGSLTWNVPVGDDTGFFMPYRPKPRPVSIIGRAADYYRGRHGFTAARTVLGLPGRETLDSSPEGCMLRYGCRSNRLAWSSDDAQKTLRLEMNSGGPYSWAWGREGSGLSREVGEMRAILNSLSTHYRGGNSG